MNPFQMPAGFGPGSQGGEADRPADLVSMPQEMRTFVPRRPERPAEADLSGAMAILARLSAACDRVARGGAPEVLDVAQLAAPSRRFLAETLGEGEVAIRIGGVPAVAAQESVFAGVWTLIGSGVDRIEVAALPSLAAVRAFAPRRQGRALSPPEGVMAAPALLSELEGKSATWAPGDDPHIVNLSLLPHTPEDLLWLDARLGEGSVTILSRGYGNCRVTATALPRVWRVQFFNSMDTPILDTFEVTDLPAVALAAPEDHADSARRIADLLEQLA